MSNAEPPPEAATCERCQKPAPLEPSGLYFCRECRMAWMPARKRA